MPALIGKKFSVYNANSFASSFASDSMYLYVGKVLTWPSDTSPPTQDDTPVSHNAIWDKMAGAARVSQNQVALGIKRNDWTSGTKYGVYHSSNTSLGDDYYVLAGVGDRDVYKCLDNNGYAPSTSKPTHKNLSISRERDGYAWKYMYTIEDTQFKRFSTSTVIPVFRNNDVSRYSRRGGFVHVPISANNTTGVGSYYRGTGYVNTSYSTAAINATIFTTVAANSYANEIRVKVDSGLSVYGNYYNNCAFLVTSGTGKGTYRKIVLSKAGRDSGTATVQFDSDGATTNVSNLVLSSSISNVSNGDTFIIGPLINAAKDPKGRGFLAIGNTNKSGNIVSIDVSLTGADFSNTANANIIGGYNPTSLGGTHHPDGSGADVELMIPPGGGHGYNPYMELNARYVIISPETPVCKDHEIGKFVGHGNEIRQVGIIKNPIDLYRGAIAFRSSYDLKTTLYTSASASVKFKPDQRVYNTLNEGTETASATVFNVCGESPNKYITVSDVSGEFANGDILYNRLGDTYTITSSNLGSVRYPSGSETRPLSSVVPGGLAKYTGEIIYHENISPITRRLDQKEEFKFIFEF